MADLKMLSTPYKKAAYWHDFLFLEFGFADDF